MKWIGLVIHYLVFLSCFQYVFSHKYSIFARLGAKSSTNERKSMYIHQKVIKYRGGISDSEYKNIGESKSISVLLSTSLGSDFLDKRKRLDLPANITVSELKAIASQKFPGSPPIQIQSLYFGVKKLLDDEYIGNLTSLSPIPIMVDVIVGTASYFKCSSIRQTMEAYVASLVHQAYINDRMRACVDETTRTAFAANTLPDSLYYRELFQTINQTVYDNYVEDIKLALEAESEAEIVDVDTVSWRFSDIALSPMVKEFAKQFDLNAFSAANFVKFSIVLFGLANFGTTSKLSSRLLLALIPMIWIYRLRSFRLATKIILYFLLHFVAQFDFIMPFIFAPWQVIAKENLRWNLGITDKDNWTSTENIEDLEEDTIDDEYEEDDIEDDDGDLLSS